MRRSDNLPASFLSSAPSIQATPGGRHLARVEARVARDLATSGGRALVQQERGRANIRALESVGLEAMDAGVTVVRHAVALSAACPAAEPMLSSIATDVGLALGQIVRDVARDLR